MDERRERDPDTGEDTYVQTGAGISDIFAKVAAKITGKTAKKLAVKAVEKGLKTLEKKLESLLAKKYMISFPRKRPSHLKQGKKLYPKRKGKKLYPS